MLSLTRLLVTEMQALDWKVRGCGGLGWAQGWGSGLGLRVWGPRIQVSRASGFRV